MYKVVKVVSLLVVLALVAGIGWAIWQKTQEQAAEGEEGGEDEAAVAVEVQNVQRGPIRNVRTFTGTLEARSAFSVAPKIGGQLEQLHVDLGDVLDRGDLLAEFDDAEHVQDVEQAEAELAVARANLDEVRSNLGIAQREYERFRTLREQQIASESEMDAAQSEFEATQSRLRVAEAQVAQREAALQAAKVRMSYTRIHAEWNDGSDQRVVGERFVDEGDMLSANTEIVSLLDIDTLRAVIHVAERDYPHVMSGQPASLMADAYPGREFEGEVVRVSPQFQRGSRQARVELAVPNDDHLLKPGMFARVRLEVGRVDDALLVPLRAVVQREEQTGVFVADEQGERVSFVPVRLGFTQDELAQVVEPDDLTGRVVTLGQHMLADESRIRVANDTSGATAATDATSEAEAADESDESEQPAATGEAIGAASSEAP